jgi:hypothetical protein
MPRRRGVNRGKTRLDYPFFAGFFGAGAATERAVLLLAVAALPALFFDIAIAFTSA